VGGTSGRPLKDVRLTRSVDTEVSIVKWGLLDSVSSK
jgi:hypothetical protein